MDNPVINSMPESALMREAITSNFNIFMEELRRLNLDQPAETVAKNLSKAVGVSTGISIYQIGLKANIEALWNVLRSDPKITDVYMSTAFKLRGMYTEDGWTEILGNLSSATTMFRGAASVIDSDARDRIVEPNNNVLLDNQWLVPVILLNYVDLSIGLTNLQNPPATAKK